MEQVRALPGRAVRRDGVGGRRAQGARAQAQLVVLDAATGNREYSSQLGHGTPFQLQWTASSQKILVALSNAGSVTYTAVTPGSGGLVVTASYEVPEGPVVLGVELPLPAG